MNKAVSRRSFLRSSAALTTGLALSIDALAGEAAPGRVYVGTYTGHDGHGEGIYLFDFDAATGGLANRKLAAATPSPSWIALHPSKRFLYAANEQSGGTGSATAFAVDPATGALRSLNTVSSHGAAPCHLSFDASGKFAFVANYVSGTIAVLPIEADGSLGEATDVQQHTGVAGAPNGATSAPPGGFTVSATTPRTHILLSMTRRGALFLSAISGRISSIPIVSMRQRENYPSHPPHRSQPAMVLAISLSIQRQMALRHHGTRFHRHALRLQHANRLSTTAADRLHSARWLRRHQLRLGNLHPSQWQMALCLQSPA